MDGDKRKRVEEEKDRNSTYTTRKKELINEARDLSVLCGVDSCMFITNAPPCNSNSNKDQVDLVYSSNSNNVGDLINKHKEQSGKKKKVVCNVSDKLPTWNSKLESMDEPELRDLASNLETKINALKIRREEMMKIKRSESLINDSLCPSPSPSPQSNDDCDLQSSSMVEPNAEAIVTNEKESAVNTIEDDTLTDLQPEFLYDPSVNYDSG